MSRIDQIQKDIDRLERKKDEMYRVWERTKPRNPAPGQAPDFNIFNPEIERLENEKAQLERE